MGKTFFFLGGGHDFLSSTSCDIERHCVTKMGGETKKAFKLVFAELDHQVLSILS